MEYPKLFKHTALGFMNTTPDDLSTTKYVEYGEYEKLEIKLKQQEDLCNARQSTIQSKDVYINIRREVIVRQQKALRKLVKVLGDA